MLSRLYQNYILFSRQNHKTLQVYCITVYDSIKTSLFELKMSDRTVMWRSAAHVLYVI